MASNIKRITLMIIFIQLTSCSGVEPVLIPMTSTPEIVDITPTVRMVEMTITPRTFDETSTPTSTPFLLTPILEPAGDLDIFVTHGDLSSENGGGIPNRVWLNERISSMSINVPLGNLPTLDGTISPGEWDQASIESFADGSQLLLMQNGEFLYVGIRASETGMIAGNIFIQRGDEIQILHSSAALGTAIYRKGEENWQQIQDFVWRCRNTGNSEAAQTERAKFLAEEGWLAANGRMGTANELEYQIKIPEGDFRLAAVYIKATTPYEKIPWPPQLIDDTITPTPGGLPDSFYFSPEQWIVLDLLK